MDMAKRSISERMEVPSLAIYSDVRVEKRKQDQDGRIILPVCGNVSGKIPEDTGANTRRFIVQLWIRDGKTIQVWHSAVDVEGGNALAFDGFKNLWNRYCLTESSIKNS